MPRRRPTRLEATVSLKHAADAAACGHMLGAVLKHALFMQQQIPCPFDELVRELERLADGDGDGARRPARPGGRMRKAARLIASAQPLLDQLPAAVAAAHESASGADGSELLAALLLGSSIAAPRVVYLIRFRSVRPTAAAGPPTPADAPA
eukprot:4582115-Prymnesium_polylepis.1